MSKKVVEFISTFPEYLINNQKDEQIRAIPRSYERVSKVYKIYKENKDTIAKRIFLNIIKGNLGNRIANEFMSFTQEDNEPLISFDDVFAGEVMPQEIISKVKKESHTRLYLTAKNILYILDNKILLDSDIKRLIELLGIYPVDLGVGIMQDIKESSNNVYKLCLENEAFVEMYFKAYNQIKG